MKANEVLKRYAAGERNFCHANLRGQSFKGQDLQGADFREADIRSADFTGANLANANFTGAKCGLQKRWAIVLVILFWLLASISGFISAIAGLFVSLILDSSSTQSQTVGWVGLIVLIFFFIVAIRQGIGAAAVGAVVVGAVGVVVVVVVVVGVAGVVAGVGVGSGVVVGVVGVGLGVVGVGLVGVEGVVVVVVGVGGYIGWRALKGDKRDAWLRTLAIAFATIGGTSFRGANLTDANFSSAKLKSTDLRKANLTGVRWYKAKMLDRARPGSSYLQYAQVRQWLIGEGKDKNFDGQKLRGINLQGADLKDASFIGADLSEANLRDANLFRAKLVQTQLDKTDLTGATLTGACIEDWGITADTDCVELDVNIFLCACPPKKTPTAVVNLIIQPTANHSLRSRTRRRRKSRKFRANSDYSLFFE